jgi:hypothetical protein
LTEKSFSALRSDVFAIALRIKGGRNGRTALKIDSGNQNLNLNAKMWMWESRKAMKDIDVPLQTMTYKDATPNTATCSLSERLGALGVFPQMPEAWPMGAQR